MVHCPARVLLREEPLAGPCARQGALPGDVLLVALRRRWVGRVGGAAARGRRPAAGERQPGPGGRGAAELRAEPGALGLLLCRFWGGGGYFLPL